MPLSEESKASITGKLIQRKNILDENAHLNFLDAQIDGIVETDKPFQFETDDITGTSLAVGKPFDGDTDGLILTDGETDGDIEVEGLTETDGEVLGDKETEGDVAGDGDAEEEGEADGDSLGEILTIVDGLAD